MDIAEFERRADELRAQAAPIVAEEEQLGAPEPSSDREWPRLPAEPPSLGARVEAWCDAVVELLRHAYPGESDLRERFPETVARDGVRGGLEILDDLAERARRRRLGLSAGWMRATGLTTATPTARYRHQAPTPLNGIQVLARSRETP